MALKPNEVFWDVGAYVGVWSLLAAKKNPSVEIYSFEPEPECFAALRHNLGLNHLNSRIKALPIALDKSSRPASLSSNGREGKCASLQSENGYLYHYPIHTYSVNDVVRMGWAAKPTIMKIDIEGAEGLVMGGISGQNRPRHLFVELHPDLLINNFQTSPVRVWDNILSLDYQPVHVWQRGSEVLAHFALK